MYSKARESFLHNVRLLTLIFFKFQSSGMLHRLTSSTSGARDPGSGGSGPEGWSNYAPCDNYGLRGGVDTSSYHLPSSNAPVLRPGGLAATPNRFSGQHNVVGTSVSVVSSGNNGWPARGGRTPLTTF